MLIGSNWDANLCGEVRLKAFPVLCRSKGTVELEVQALSQRRDTLVSSVKHLEEKEAGYQNSIAQLTTRITHHRASLESAQPATSSPITSPPPPPPPANPPPPSVVKLSVGDKGVSARNREERGGERSEVGGARLTESWMNGAEEEEAGVEDVTMDVLELERTTSKVNLRRNRCH